MQYTYIASDNTVASPSYAGTALGATDQDVVVYKILFGLGADGVYAKLYDKHNPILGSTSNLAAFVTQPTAAAGKQYFQVVDFGSQGLQLGEGGNIVTNASQVTVVWDFK